MALRDPSDKQRAKPLLSSLHILEGQVDALLAQQIPDVMKRQREPDAEHYRQADDLGRG
jgi:hypothetical protein